MEEEKYLKREQVPQYLDDRFNVSFAKSTLAKMAVQGTGPSYCKVGRHPMYPVSTLDDWMNERFGILRKCSKLVQK